MNHVRHREGAVAVDEERLGAAQVQLGGDGDAEAAAEAVDDAAHAVDGHRRGAARDEDAPALQRGAADGAAHLGDQRVLVGEVVLAVGVARRHDPHAQGVEPLQRLHQDAVVQRAVHGGGDEHRGAAALEPAEGRGGGRGDHAVGHAGGDLVDGVVGGRRHQVGVEGRAVAEVLGGGGEPLHGRVHGAPLERLGGDVAQRLLRREGDHRRALTPQRSRHEGDLHRGDAACDQEGHAAAGEVRPLGEHVVIAEAGGGRRGEGPVAHGPGFERKGAGAQRLKTRRAYEAGRLRVR